MHEEAILKWVLELHDSLPDVIENVDRKTLKDLISDVEHLAVFFCKYIMLTKTFNHKHTLHTIFTQYKGHFLSDYIFS